MGRIISKTIVPSILSNVILLILWETLIQIANIGVAAFIGLPTINSILISLWLSGLVFGYIYGKFRAKNDPRLLLKDDIGVAMVLGIIKEEKERQKLEKIINELKETIPMPKPKELLKEVNDKLDFINKKLNIRFLRAIENTKRKFNSIML